MNRILLPLISAFAVVLISSCGKDDASTGDIGVLSEDDGVLAYVPADTPYVFASPEPLPEDVLEKVEANADSVYGAYETVIRETVKTMEAENGDDEEARAVITMIGEIMSLMRSDERRAAGVPRSPQLALYGVGMLPVVRIELNDSDKFDEKITEIIGKTDLELNDAEVAGEAYRYVGDDAVRFAIATIDDFAVAAIVPSELSDDQLANVLGVNEPAESIADTGALEALAEQYGFGPYLLGFFDMERLGSVFLDTATGVNAELLSMMDYDPATLSDVCRDEIREFTQIVPRLASGYKSVSTQRLESNTIFEIRDDLASGLMSLTAPVPGLGTDHGGLGSFGMSIDLLAAREFYEARLAALEADPFQCEYFAELQAGFAQGGAALNQPLPPIVYGFKGFVAIIDNIDGFDIANQRPPEEIEARILIANDNAAGLLAMGSMFSPELASLNLEPNGDPVALNVPPFTDSLDAAWVAMTGDALGLAVGEGTDAGLKSLLESDIVSPSPFMSMSLDGARYYQMMSDIVGETGPLPGPDGSTAEVSPEMQRAMTQVMTGVGDMIERISVDVTFTENGVEIPSRITLAD